MREYINRFDGVPLVMRVCEHDVLHPDPDSLEFFIRNGWLEPGEGHQMDCDGCCIPRPLGKGER